MSNASLELGGGNWAAKDNGDGTGSLLGYAVGDTSGKYLPREFTFSRGADIAATRVNKDGLIEKYRENLLTYSNQFDTTWTTTNISLTSGQSGHDGSNDAWLAQGNGLGTSRLQHGGLDWSNSVYTLSFYAKAGTESVVNVFDGTWSGVIGATYDLSTGTATQYPISIPVVEVTMVSVGNGWWRCSFTAIPNERTNTSGFVRIGIGSTTAANSGNIYIQDAQLEYGLVATDYLESGSTTGKAGVLDNLPRIDYTSGSAQLLMEPSRTNYIEQSEYFNAWTKQSNVTVTDNSTTSPSGFNDASKYSISASTNRALDQTTTLTSGVTYTFSMWVKAIVDTTIRVRSDASDWSEDISLLVSDGWKRIESTHTMGITEYEFGFFDVSGSTGDRFYIWGAQLEAGSYATSYIPNYGTALGVTRNGDSTYKNNINSILGNTGTLFLEIEPYEVNTSTSVYKKILGLFKTNGSVADAIYLEEYNGDWGVWVRKGNSTITSTGYKSTQPTKVAVTFGVNGSRVYFDGVQEAFTAVDTSNEMKQISTQSNAGNPVESVLKLKQLVYFPTELTVSELTSLTTL